MIRSPRRRTIRTLLLAALVLLAVPASTLAQGPPGGNGPGDEAGPPNGTQAQGNGTGDNRSQPNGSGDRSDRAGQGPPSDRDRGPPEGTPGRADPVAIRDLATGFRTQPPVGSVRPSVAVDAASGQARVQRADVAPMSLQVDSVIEYVDEDADGAYDLGELVVNRTPLRGAPFDVVADPANETRDVVYRLGQDGQLVLRFDLGTAHGPAVGAKFDVLVQGYAFQHPESRLAIGTRVDAPAGLQVTDVDGAPALQGTSGQEVAYLSWVGDVQVDGQTREVGWSVHVSNTDQGNASQSAIVYWSYPQGETIVHDPVLGVTSALSAVAGSLAPFALGLTATLGILAVGYGVRRRIKL